MKSNKKEVDHQINGNKLSLANAPLDTAKQMNGFGQLENQSVSIVADGKTSDRIIPPTLNPDGDQKVMINL